MVISIHGLPGVGKNVYATYLCLKHYKKTNSFISRFKRKIHHEPIWINNVYTSYPVLLDKKRNVYSRRVSPYDLQNNYRFIPNALIVIDEIQAFWDSDEFKDFPKEIAVFNQFHRHFGISNIIYISQHPSRIVKKLRNITCQLRKVRSLSKIPFLPIGIIYYTNYYELEDYGKWHHPMKEAKTYDVDNHFVLFNIKKVFRSYNSIYLHTLNDDKPLLLDNKFSKLDLSENEIETIFNNLS